MSFGDRLKQLISNYGFRNLADAAKNIGIDYPSLSRIVNNKQVPGADRIIKISEFFDVSTDYLLTGREPGQKGRITQVGGNVSNVSGEVTNFSNINGDVSLRYDIELPDGSHVKERRAEFRVGHIGEIMQVIKKLNPKQQKKLLKLISISFDLDI